MRVPLLVGYSCCAIVLTFVSSRGPTNPERRVPSWFVLLSLATFVALRLPTVFVNAALDPDEAQWLASAMKFHTNMNTWLSVDTTSSGPVNIYPLMWPFLFGADAGFAVARITTIALVGATWLLTVSALSSAPRAVRVCLAACLIVFLGGIQATGLVHYSSEIVPVFFLMCALRIILSGVERPLTTAQLCLAGFCLGLVPFAKLQATIIAAVMGLILVSQVMLQMRRRPYRSGAWLVFSACLPALILLGPLAAAGGLSDFWSSYVGFATNYLGKGWGEIQASSKFMASVDGLIGVIREHLIRGYFMVMAVTTLLGLVALVRQVSGAGQARAAVFKSPEAVRWAIAGAALAASIWAVMAPARPFAHYAALALWPAALVAGLAWSLETPLPRRDWTAFPAYGVIGGTSIIILLGLALGEQSPSYNLETVGVESLIRAGQFFADPDSERGRVLIWGWMPQWYVWSGWTPATRDMHTYNQIWPTPLRSYFRDRLMSDLRRDPPEYIIDAVASGDFGFGDSERYGIGSFPELADFVAADYEALSLMSPDGSCPMVFARNSTARAFEQTFVKPSHVYATSDWSAGSGTYSANRVVDGVVFERCPDAWWPNDGDGRGEITLELERPEAIARIELLNTRGGRRRDRASKNVRVMAYRGHDVILDEGVHMARFPYWTQIALPDRAGSVDRFVARIETYAGVGGGLNEIRLRRRR